MKMPPVIDTAFFAPCGMNCMVCYKHCYMKKPCAGCLPGDEGKPEHCRKCKIKDCVQGKGFTYCYECNVFPCKLIKNLEKSYNKRYGASLMENSLFVKAHGLTSLNNLSFSSVYSDFRSISQTQKPKMRVGTALCASSSRKVV